MESTNIRVKLNSVEQVRQFVETMRKYDGDVDVYSSNRNYLVDGKSILGVFSLGLDQELTVKFYNGATESFINKLNVFITIIFIANSWSVCIDTFVDGVLECPYKY